MDSTDNVINRCNHCHMPVDDLILERRAIVLPLIPPGRNHSTITLTCSQSCLDALREAGWQRPGLEEMLAAPQALQQALEDALGEREAD